jgi:hypothetical protein
VRIFTALFFIQTDYIATLLNPYFLDFERGWRTIRPKQVK